MFIALTGTPGTGKTAVSLLLQKQGNTVVSVNDIAYQHMFFQGVDERRDSKILDIIKIGEYLRHHHSSTEYIFVEGHASHHLSCIEKVILLRCHPTVLEQRLRTRKWSVEKIQENIEAEALDVILCEAAETYQKESLFEINTTKMSTEDTVQSIVEIIHNGFKPMTKYTIGNIDWSEEIF